MAKQKTQVGLDRRFCRHELINTTRPIPRSSLKGRDTWQRRWLHSTPEHCTRHSDPCGVTLFSADDIETGRLSKSTEARINNVVQQLDPVELERFQKLAQPFKNRRCLDKERFLANSFLMTRHLNGRQTKGIFLWASGFQSFMHTDRLLQLEPQQNR